MRIVRILSPKAQEGFGCEAEPVSHGPEVFLEERRVEAVMAGGDGCVRRENNLSRDAGRCFVEVDTFLLHPITNRLENCKRAMPFVQVKDSRGEPHRLERPVSADTQQKLLPDAYTPIATIQTGGEIA